MPEELKHDGPHADLTREIIGAAIAVQRALGPGLLESAYEACLAHELSLAGHRVERQIPLGLSYRGLEVPQAFRMDLVVDGKVLVELKVVDAFVPEHEAQVLSYLRFSGLTVGLLINFKSIPLTKSGLRRFVLSEDNSIPSVLSA